MCYNMYNTCTPGVLFQHSIINNTGMMKNCTQLINTAVIKNAAVLQLLLLYWYNYRSFVIKNEAPR